MGKGFVMKNISLLGWGKEKQGQTLIEYGLIVVLVSLVAIIILQTLGIDVRDIFVLITNVIAG